MKEKRKKNKEKRHNFFSLHFYYFLNFIILLLRGACVACMHACMPVLAGDLYGDVKELALDVL
jgi:hypothetical protein